MDSYLKKFAEKYDTWLEKNLIDVSSKVIPIHESLTEQKHIIPKDQAEEILGSARLIALAKCVCRDRYNNCDKPREVCFILNSTGDKWIDKGLARNADMVEAKEILKQANDHGLVHMTLFKPDHEVFALCSCCACCCHDLQLVLKYGKSYITAKSDFTATDTPALCTLCGTCIGRCPFDARAIEKNQLICTPESCYGCGLCVTSCPENAIELVPTDK